MMNDCHVCKKKRMARGLAPRPLQRLPDQITKHGAFKHKEIPVFVCAECDGEVLERSIIVNERRMQRKSR